MPNAITGSDRTVKPHLRSINFIIWRESCQLFGIWEAKLFARDLLEFQKRRQPFIRSHNQTLSVIAMRVCNPDCSPARIHG
jgi:hypothetical protein